jgi:hypothetical protein
MFHFILKQDELVQSFSWCLNIKFETLKNCRIRFLTIVLHQIKI